MGFCQSHGLLVSCNLWLPTQKGRDLAIVIDGPWWGPLPRSLASNEVEIAAPPAVATNDTGAVTESANEAVSSVAVGDCAYRWR